jgi:hypothetical protein
MSDIRRGWTYRFYVDGKPTEITAPDAERAAHLFQSLHMAFWPVVPEIKHEPAPPSPFEDEDTEASE